MSQLLASHLLGSKLRVAELMDATCVGPGSLWRAARDLRRRARQNLSGSDEDLLRQIARGDGDALAVLHHRCAHLVQINVRRVLDEPALAELLTDQIFDDLSTVAGRFDPSRGDARMWLLALAHERATARANGYPAPTRSVAVSAPPTTSRATRLSFRLLRRA